MKDVKDKVADVAATVKEKLTHKDENKEYKAENTYQYTVKFEDIEDDVKTGGTVDYETITNEDMDKKSVDKDI